ncbi:MAG: type VI secretion system baseplate subunit TssK [Rhodospirillaceae bacterium]|jgi:type VI secretion system protein ImpJ|uniref:type VI secretion system baseplate subunit TssK n=1 Tax=unclassified Hwanghaeella TaxID=2605944 RepID=UPI000C4CDAFD|nr:type VI secretion system baseplate subunit TssK [Rhodospirillaceae bacterium]|tara:strand:+ start:8133 stop:9485 length:1353 start_codon:yes stop_codon:yes gene_type:complete
MPRSARELPDAIQWHEGMLLAPQHFQQLGVRGEELIAYHTATSSPFHWGIRHLKVDPVQLVSGIFRVLELEAVLPDGLIVSHVQGDDVPLELDLSEQQGQLMGKPVPIYLAVPVRRLGGRATRGDLPRYQEVPGLPISDEHTGEGEMTIPRLKPRLSLHLTDSLAQKYVGFPIARLMLREEAFTMTNFVPAQLSITRVSAIGEMCQAVATRLREKAMFLAERARTPLGQTDKPMLQQSQTAIHGLVAGLPMFEAILKTDRCHPFPLYLSLCQIVGHMTAVGGALVPPMLPSYDHNDPKAAFSAACDFVIQMLDRVSEAYTAIPFEEADGVFSLKIDPAWCDDDLTIGVRARAEMTEADVIAWMDVALVGSDSVIKPMRERRVLGAPRHRIDREQALDVVPTRGVVLFKIEVNFDDIVPGEKLSILSGDRGRREPPQEIVLYVRNPSGDDR